MPDGTSKRHTPGDGSPAEPIPRVQGPRRPGPTGRERPDPDYDRRPDPDYDRRPDPEYDRDGVSPEGPVGYPDQAPDQAGRRSGRARRVANWFGFGAPAEEDEPDPYDRRPGFGRRDPYEADAGVYDYGRDQGPEYDPDYDAAPPPTSGRTRRRTGSSHWEDVMLGSSPSPGTPMSDSIPGDTMPPDRLHREPQGVLPPSRGTARPGRREDPAPRWQPEPEDHIEPADPMDPVDPLDPGPSPSSERRPAYPPIPKHRPAPAAESDRATTVDTMPALDDEPDDRRRFDAGSTPDPDDDGEPGTSFVPAPAAPRVPYRPEPAAESAVDEVPRRMLRMLPPPALADGGGMVVDGGRLGRLNVRAAGVRGELHQQQGLPRQNCFAVGPDPSARWTIAIVCDGVDNAHASELAAQIAVRSAYRTVARMVARERHENWDWAGVQTEVEEDLRTRLAGTADRAHEMGRSEPATRLAILVTAADPLEDDRVDMAVLGDSTVLRLAQGGWRAPLGIRDASAEAAPAAIPGQAGDDQLRICRTTWRPTDVLVMMTGGFAEALGQPTAGLAPRLAEDWRTPPSLFDYLRDVDEGLRLRDDDGCVVALWPLA